jgi:hypothetical protein
MSPICAITKQLGNVLISGRDGRVQQARWNFPQNLSYRMKQLLALLLSVTSGAALAQTTGTVDPGAAPAEPSAKADVPSGGCMPIGLTASGEMVFPIQCNGIIERGRGSTLEQKPAILEDNATAKSEAPASDNPIIKPVESVPLPKRVERERAISSGDCSHYRTYDRASGSYRDYHGRRRSCR